MWRSYNSGWEDCEVVCSTPASRLRLINLSKLASRSHQGLLRAPGLSSRSNCLPAFSLFEALNWKWVLSKFSAPASHREWGHWVLYTGSWHQQKRGEEHSGVSSFSADTHSLHNRLLKCLPSVLPVRGAFTISYLLLIVFKEYCFCLCTCNTIPWLQKPDLASIPENSDRRLWHVLAIFWFWRSLSITLLT